MKRHHHHHHHHHHQASHLDDPRRDDWQRPADVVAALELIAGMTVADVGAGTGYFVPHLRRAVGDTGRVLALDVNPARLRQRFQEANVEVREVTWSDPALDEGSVDRVLIVDVWHHLEDRVEYAKKLRRALKPGGRVCVIDRPPPSGDAPPDGAHDSPHAPPAELQLSADAVLAELTAAGFAARVVKALPRQFVVVALAR